MGATGAVVDAGGRLLLVRDADAEAWYAPGGTVQPGESLREGLVREIEEPGLTEESIETAAWFESLPEEML